MDANIKQVFLNENKATDIKTLLDNQKKEFELRKKETREAIIQEYIQEMYTEHNTLRQLDRRYLNEKVWMRITDAERFRELFPKHLWRIADDIDRYYVFIKKSNPKLFKIEELESKRLMLIEKYKNELRNILFDKRVDPKLLDSATYYVLIDLLKNNGVSVEDESEDVVSTPVVVNTSKKK